MGKQIWVPSSYPACPLERNNNTKLETQTKIILPEQGMQKRCEAVVHKDKCPDGISCDDLVPGRGSMVKALMGHIKVSLQFRKTTRA